MTEKLGVLVNQGTDAFDCFHDQQAEFAINVGEIVLKARTVIANQTSVQQQLSLIGYGKGGLAILHNQPLK